MRQFWIWFGGLSALVGAVLALVIAGQIWLLSLPVLNSGVLGEAIAQAASLAHVIKLSLGVGAVSYLIMRAQRMTHYFGYLGFILVALAGVISHWIGFSLIDGPFVTMTLVVGLVTFAWWQAALGLRMLRAPPSTESDT